MFGFIFCGWSTKYSYTLSLLSSSGDFVFQHKLHSKGIYLTCTTTKICLGIAAPTGLSVKNDFQSNFAENIPCSFSKFVTEILA